jgi:hypothetical protein
MTEEEQIELAMTRSLMEFDREFDREFVVQQLPKIYLQDRAWNQIELREVLCNPNLLKVKREVKSISMIS